MPDGLVEQRREHRVHRVLHDPGVAPGRAGRDRLALVQRDRRPALGEERGERAADDPAPDHARHVSQTAPPWSAAHLAADHLERGGLAALDPLRRAAPALSVAVERAAVDRRDQVPAAAQARLVRAGPRHRAEHEEPRGQVALRQLLHGRVAEARPDPGERAPALAARSSTAAARSAGIAKFAPCSGRPPRRWSARRR